MQATEPTVRDKAEYLQSLGFDVFPCHNAPDDPKRHKTPRAGKSWKDDPPKGGWRWRADDLVGVRVPERGIVVDIDNPDLFAKSGLELTPTVSSPTQKPGREHHFYRTDSEAPQVVEGNTLGYDTRVGGKGYVIAWHPERWKPLAEWAMAPEFVYKPVHKASAPPLDAGEPMGTRVDLTRWLGRMAIANPSFGAGDFLALLKQAKADGRIIDLDPKRPWTDKDFQVLASESGKWAEAERNAPVLLFEPGNGKAPDLILPDRELTRADERPTAPPGELFHLIEDVVVDHAHRAIPWMLEDLLYYRGAFLVAGAPKVGKSTMIADIARARSEGVPWAGKNLSTGPTLLLTEEGPMPVAWRWHRAREMTVTFRFEALAQWAEERDAILKRGVPARVVDEAFPFAAWVQKRVRNWLQGQWNALVIVDTLAVWNSMEDENSATEATRAITGWTKLAQETGACILLIHHMRKSGGTHGEGIRGSSAILGTSDGSWEVARASEMDGDTKRKVTFTSRIGFEPAPLTLDYDPETGIYSPAATGPDPGEIERWLEVIPADRTTEGRTKADLMGLWDVAKSTAEKRIKTLRDAGRLHQEEGKIGARQKGWRYWAVPPAGRAPVEPEKSSGTLTFRDVFEESD